MNRRDFLKQLGLIATLPLTGALPFVPLIPGFLATHTVGGWFKPHGGGWQFAATQVTANEAVSFPAKATHLDGQVAMVFVCSEALPDEQIEALYQESRQWFEG